MKIKRLTSILAACLVVGQIQFNVAQAAVSLAKTKPAVEQTQVLDNSIKNSEISNIRYSKSDGKVRLVFDLNETTQYEVKSMDNGYVMIDFSEPIAKNYASGINVMMLLCHL